jgi:hypothetical protein
MRVIVIAVCVFGVLAAPATAGTLRPQARRYAQDATGLVPVFDGGIVKVSVQRCWRAASHRDTVIFTCRSAAYVAWDVEPDSGSPSFSRCPVRVRVYFPHGRFDGYSSRLAADCLPVPKGELVPRASARRGLDAE